MSRSLHRAAGVLLGLLITGCPGCIVFPTIGYPIGRIPAGEIRLTDEQTDEEIHEEALIVPEYLFFRGTTLGEDSTGITSRYLSRPFKYRSGEELKLHQPVQMALIYCPWGFSTLGSARVEKLIIVVPGYVPKQVSRITLGAPDSKRQYEPTTLTFRRSDDHLGDLKQVARMLKCVPIVVGIEGERSRLSHDENARPIDPEEPVKDRFTRAERELIETFLSSAIGRLKTRDG